MLFYHYSTQKHSTLKTLLKQGKVKLDEKKKEEEIALKHKTLFGIFRPGYYYEHISFFIDPIPENIASYFPKGHDVWFKGNNLYQHVIEIDINSSPFYYEVVEFPERINLYYDDTVDDKLFFSKVGKMLKNEGYIGKGYIELNKVLHEKNLLNKTSEYYQLLPNRPNYDKICNKYAATVPHLMLYPLLGYFKVKEVELITLK